MKGAQLEILRDRVDSTMDFRTWNAKLLVVIREAAASLEPDDDIEATIVIQGDPKDFLAVIPTSSVIGEWPRGTNEHPSAYGVRVAYTLGRLVEDPRLKAVDVGIKYAAIVVPTWYARSDETGMREHKRGDIEKLPQRREAVMVNSGEYEKEVVAWMSDIVRSSKYPPLLGPWTELPGDSTGELLLQMRASLKVPGGQDFYRTKTDSRE